MKPLSIGKAWEESVAFVKREGALLFPVAFLFMALPIVVFQQMVPAELMAELTKANVAGAERTAPVIPATFWLGLGLTLAITLIGALTLYALALRPGISVAEAMRHAIRRLPVLVGAGLLVAVVGFVLALALGVLVTVLAMAGGAKALTSLAGAMVVGVFLFLGVRMLLMQALAIDQPVGPIDAIRQSWALTRGHFWRLLSFMMVLLLVSMVIQFAVQSIFGVIGGLAGGAELALLFGSIATAAISAVIQVYFMVMTARIYWQLQNAG